MYLARKILKLWYRIYDPSLHSPTLKEQHLIDELRQTIRSLPSVEKNGLSGAEDFWVQRRSQIRELVHRKDPRTFLRWEPIIETMYVGDAKNICQEFDHLRKSSNWSSRWRALTKASPAGHPRSSALFPGRSGNIIHHAYHLCRLEEETGVDIAELGLIVEIGGGYGNLGRMVYQLGFKGKYIIYDVPEFCALQDFYLQLTGVPLYSSSSSQVSGVLTVSDSKSLLSYFSAWSKEKTAFFATWSMSETSSGVRQELMPLLSMCDVVLIGYQERFCDVDNVEFFTNMRRTLSPSYKWSDNGISHLPGNRYLFGVKL